MDILTINSYLCILQLTGIPIHIFITNNMKRITLIFIIIISSLYSIGAQENDTIISQLESLSDTNKVNLLSNTINTILFQKPSLAMEYLDIYSEIPLVKSSEHRICYIYTSKGLIYEMLGNFALALEYDYKALELAEKISDSVNIAHSLANIGFLYSNQSQQYDKSIEYQKKSLEIWKSLKNLKHISRTYSNISSDFRLMNENDSALYYQLKSLTIFKMVVDSGAEYDRNLALKYSGIAGIFLNTNKLDSAQLYYNKAQLLLENNSMDFELAELYYGIGINYYKKKDYVNSELYYQKAIDKAKALDLKSFILKYRFYYAELQSKKGDYEYAYKLLEKLFFAADSINSAETRNRIAEVQGKYFNEKNLRKIENLEHNNELQSIKEQYYIIGIIALLVFAFGIITIILLKKRKDKLLTHQKVKIYEQEKELANAEQEKSDILRQELENELKFRNKELTTHALNMMQKNKLLDSLSLRIDEFKKVSNDEQKGEIRKIKREINNYLRSDKDWELFKIYFEQVNESFFDDLKDKYPDLSINDLRLCALIKLDMNIKESASVLNVAPNTIKSARYRLRKKLKLDTETHLYEFIQSI